MIVPFSPMYGTIFPAIEPTMMMREGSVAVADFARSGAALQIFKSFLTRGRNLSSKSDQSEVALHIKIENFDVRSYRCRFKWPTPSRCRICN
jgi:hypothetical protein